MTIFFQDDFTRYPTGNLSLTPALIDQGYIDFENSGHPRALQILPRAKLPSALIADPRFPKDKACALQVNLSANEIIARLTWAKYPADTRIISQSMWQYRTRVGGEINANRLIDSIWTLGAKTGLTLIDNGAKQFPSPDRGFGLIPGFPPGLVHIESVMGLSTADNADGWADFYVNGTRLAHVEGYRYFENAADAAIGWQVSDLGGWSSTGRKTEGRVAYPIKYYVCAWRLADEYQGVWEM